MTVSFLLKNQVIRRTDSNTVVAQSKNYLRAKFNALTGDWNGPITAIFNEYTVILDDNNECVVPWEVLQNPGTVKVSAFCGDLHTASVATMVVNPSGYVDGQTPKPPTPDVYTQIVELAQEAVETASSVREDANSGKFDGKSAYEIAVHNGFIGTEEEWLESLRYDHSEEFTELSNQVLQNAQKAEQSATNAKDSEDKAKDYAEKAEQGAANAGNSAENARSSSQTAVASAQSAKESADTAILKATEAEESATAASASATKAASSADSAEQSAQRAEDAVSSIPQIDDSQASPTNPWSGQKTSAELANKVNTNQGAENAGKVLGIGDDGSIVPVDASSGIDDTKITTANPWSSAKIVDTVCPPFEVTGPIVTCNPVAGYPLHVVSQIVALQEGEGDPSPENVRPITGWTEANLFVAGRNLFDGSIHGSKNISGVTIEYDPETQVFTLNGTASGTLASKVFGLNIPGYNMAFTLSSDVLSGGLQGDGVSVAFFGCGDSKNESINYINIGLARSESKTGICQYRYVTSFWFYVDKGVTFDNLKVKIQLEVGNQAMPYTPYNPASKTITLSIGQTVYGGTLDWTNGVLTVTHAEIASYNGEDLPGYWISDRDIYSKDTTPTTGAQVVYELSEPQTVQLTPQEILALSGVNTIYTDTGDTTVSGRADPTTIINQLAARIAALESAATNI